MSPSIGRVVLFHGKGEEPSPAIITRVWSDTCVNLHVFLDENGSIPVTSVAHRDTYPGGIPSWSWPPRT